MINNLKKKEEIYGIFFLSQTETITRRMPFRAFKG